jgi:hypothetical protein
LMKVFGRQKIVFYLIGDFLSKFYAHKFFPEFPTGLQSYNNDEVSGYTFVCVVVITCLSVKGHAIMWFGSRVAGNCV